MFGIIFRLFPLAVALPCLIFLFFELKNALSVLFPSLARNAVFYISLGVSVALAVPMAFFFDWGSTVGLFILHFVFIALLLRLIFFIIRKCKSPSAMLTKILKCGLIPLVCSAVILVSGSVNMHTVRQTEYNIKTDKSISENGYKVAFISDIHHGTSTDAESLREIADRISAQGVDVLVLVGDITDESTTAEELREVYEIFGNVKTEHGVYFVYGNHDRSLYNGQKNYGGIDLAEAITDAGITVLEDEAVEPTEGLVLVGRKDRSTGREDMSTLLKGIDRDKFILVADHQPVEFSEKADAGADAQISGHTHGGQIWPLAYINTLISANDLCYGHERVGNMDAFVTSGASGWGFSVRTQGISEYVILNIGK